MVAKKACKAILSRGASHPAIGGGLALQAYGSPAFTKDVDFLVVDEVDLRPQFKFERPISFGGAVYLDHATGIPVDLIFRSDEYADLYENAVVESVRMKVGLRVITAEHLAVIKLQAGRSKDYEGLMFLLGECGLVNVKKAANIAHRFLGGQYAVEQFKAAVEEARWRANQK